MPSQYLQTISTLYLVQKKFQFEAISLLVHTFPRVAQAMWWVAQAMWSGLRRLCGVVIIKLKANLSSTGTELGKIRAECCLQKKFHQMIHYLVEQFCKIVHNLAEQFSQIARYLAEHQIQTDHVLYSYYQWF